MGKIELSSGVDNDGEPTVVMTLYENESKNGNGYSVVFHAAESLKLGLDIISNSVKADYTATLCKRFDLMGLDSKELLRGDS